MRVLSAYDTRLGERVWVITEADRAVTTLRRPDEYCGEETPPPRQDSTSGRGA